MIELLIAILNGVTRRVDGMDKTNQKWRGTIQLAVRVLPVIFGYLLVLPYCTEWYHNLYGFAFGGIVSASMQRKPDGWEHFSLRQITQHYHAALAYLPLAVLSIPLALSGFVCCLLAGLVHPTLARTPLKHYSAVAEFLSSFILLLPFVMVIVFQ